MLAGLFSMNFLWYLFAVSFLFFPFSWARVEFGDFSVPMQLFILVGIFFFWALKFLARAVDMRSLKTIPRYYLVLAVFFLASVLSSVAHGLDNFGRTVHFWAFLWVAVFLAIAIDKEDVLKKTLVIIIGGIAIQALFGLFSFVSGGEVGWLQVGDVGTRNANAFVFQVAAVISLGLITGEKSRLSYKAFLIACFCVCVFGAFYTLSRGGLLGIIFAVLIMMRKSKYLVVLLVVIGISLAFLPDKYIVRFTSYFNYKESYLMVQGTRMTNSIPLRIKLAQESLDKIAEKPFFGEGPGYYKASSQNAGDLEGMTWPHNSYLGIWIEEGLAGFIAYVMMFVMLMKYILNAMKSARDKGLDVPVLLNVAYILLLTVYFDSFFVDLYDWIYYWTIIGLVAAMAATAKKRIQDEMRYNKG